MKPPAATAVSTISAGALAGAGIVAAGDDAAEDVVEGAVDVAVVPELQAPTKRARLTAPATVIERFMQVHLP
ncbi:MAG: hypothetical protein WCG47_21605 [Dermatophilaceae bacterium]